MNFYKHYIGDFQRDTGHLSLTERGAYRALLDHHYATEKPLPVETTALCRMVGAVSKAERDAVVRVLNEFWTKADTGWINARAMREMGKADHQREVNRAIAEQREAKRKAARSSNEQSTNRATNDQPNQTPDTRHQTGDTSVGTRSARAPGDAEDDPPEANGQPPTQAGTICRALRAAGISRASPSNVLLGELIAAGATAEELLGLVPDALGKGDPFRWLLAAAAGQRKEAAEIAAGMHRGPMPAASTESPYQRQMREHMERWAPAVAAKAPSAGATAAVPFIDMEVPDAPRRLG